MKIVSIMNLKGGVGKTTTACNMAVALAGIGSRVLLIDIDQQANSTGLFLSDDLDEEVGITKAIIQPEETVAEIRRTEYQNLDILPSTLTLAIKEKQLMCSTLPNHNRLKKVIEQVRDRYDYIIIDCSPSLGTLAVNVLFATNEVIIPIKISKDALQGYKRTMEHIKEMEEAFGLTIETKVLFTMVNRNNTDREIINNFDKTDCFEQTIRSQAKPVTQASFDKKLVIEGNSGVGKDYEAWMKEYQQKKYLQPSV